MNNLRIPLALLAIILVALVAWFIFSRQPMVQTPQPESAATTTTAVATSQTSPTPTQAAPLNQTAVASSVVGSWQSTEDSNYSIVVTADGAWTDRYKGDATSSVAETGTYTLFTSQNPDPNFVGAVPGIVYLKVSEGTSVYYYSVLKATDNSLQLSYLDRGTTLSFVKVQ